MKLSSNQVSSASYFDPNFEGGWWVVINPGCFERFRISMLEPKSVDEWVIIDESLETIKAISARGEDIAGEG